MIEIILLILLGAALAGTVATIAAGIKMGLAAAGLGIVILSISSAAAATAAMISERRKNKMTTDTMAQLDPVIKIVQASGKFSYTDVQRKTGLAYYQVKKIRDILEDKGIIDSQLNLVKEPKK